MKKIESILIVNRGEIASRIIRACQKMGIKSIAVYTDADQKSPYVQEADTALYIGENNPSESYLNQDKIIEKAKSAGADAIHPGYGFLSENADFARRCKKEGLIFIGPHADAIEMMGSKSKAKNLMQENGVPIVPGYLGVKQDTETLIEKAKEIGFPVLLKATAGGGGKGMRIVEKEEELKSAVEAAKREAKNAFGNDEMMVEKYISSGRHIEFQIVGDQHGNSIHLLERECTLQRRHQKVVEESPSPVMDEELRAKMGEAAVKAAKALNYDNAGTVEFIYDEKSGDFYFLEVNTRLQVEHPVTEEVTGVDLVEWQIEIAQGYPLPCTQDEIKGKGYAVEVRLYAEDAHHQFLPVTGIIEKFKIPKIDGLRVETAIQTGSEISIHYDPMIAKLIVWDKNREAAHRKLKYVLTHLVCLGITTNQDFLRYVCEQEDFQKGNYNTHYIQNKILPFFEKDSNKDKVIYSAIASTVWDWKQREDKRTLLRSLPSGWRNNFYSKQSQSYQYKEDTLEVKYKKEEDVFFFEINDQTFQVKLITQEQDNLRLAIDGVQHSFVVVQKNEQFHIHNEFTGPVTLEKKERFPIPEKTKIKGNYEAPMPSQVIKILVKEGDEVEEGTPLIILSSMKMENTMYALEGGIVKEIYTAEGENIEAGHLVMKIEDN